MPPLKYEKIRDSYIASGKSEATAKKIAAMTYNSQRKPGQAPVTPHSRKKEKKRAARMKRTRGAGHRSDQSKGLSSLRRY